MHRPHAPLPKAVNAHALALAFASLLSLSACADKRAQNETAQATPAPVQSVNAPATQPTQTASPAATDTTPTPAPPQASEINDKVARIFQGAVETDARQKTPALVGDFNGDGSEDIAVVVKPNPDKLEEINGDVANWVLVDPQTFTLPDPHKAVQKLPPAPAPVKVQPDDVLLAVIHGYEREGWRNPAAQQTYLLKNAVGRDLRVRSSRDATKDAALLHTRNLDLIQEDLNGASGFLYWTAGRYVWFPASKRAMK
jgi:hypothetical protein